MARRSQAAEFSGTRYIVAVRGDPENHLFGFPTARARALFIEDLLRLDPEVEYATAENPPAASSE